MASYVGQQAYGQQQQAPQYGGQIAGQQDPSAQYGGQQDPQMGAQDPSYQYGGQAQNQSQYGQQQDPSSGMEGQDPSSQYGGQEQSQSQYGQQQDPSGGMDEMNSRPTSQKPQQKKMENGHGPEKPQGRKEENGVKHDEHKDEHKEEHKDEHKDEADHHKAMTKTGAAGEIEKHGGARTGSSRNFHHTHMNALHHMAKSASNGFTPEHIDSLLHLVTYGAGALANTHGLAPEQPVPEE